MTAPKGGHGIQWLVAAAIAFTSAAADVVTFAAASAFARLIGPPCDEADDDPSR
ncbi:hypothetical protein [Allorhodopirellula heiligendammensis]|uniref:hypothetical protein n=1 Tax=Allorhodopirellula heiligendammensis TaxID=2714739 RepID=UPI0026602A8B|nr:hypothetical protein [Allorhodopirellula heiligendammensis]